MIYFAKMDYKEESWLRIAYTKSRLSLEQRLLGMESASPFHVEVLMLTEGDKDHEKRIGKIFTEYLVQKKWYVYSGKLKEFVSNVEKHQIDKAISLADPSYKWKEVLYAKLNSYDAPITKKHVAKKTKNFSSALSDMLRKKQ